MVTMLSQVLQRLHLLIKVQDISPRSQVLARSTLATPTPAEPSNRVAEPERMNRKDCKAAAAPASHNKHR
ncbi:unnamed protein product [Boreogadus saida]